MGAWVSGCVGLSCCLGLNHNTGALGKHAWTTATSYMESYLCTSLTLQCPWSVSPGTSLDSKWSSEKSSDCNCSSQIAAAAAGLCLVSLPSCGQAGERDSTCSLGATKLAWGLSRSNRALSRGLGHGSWHPARGKKSSSQKHVTFLCYWKF